MARPKISICLGTFNRAHLLWRALECYASQPFKDFDLYVIDDASTDSTFELCKKWQKHLDLKYIYIGKPEGVTWRDSSANINIALRAANGQLIVYTHPEVLVGLTTMEEAYSLLGDNRFINAKIYYLDPVQQKAIDTVDWRTDRLNVRQLPDFYKPSVNNFNSDYEHANMDKCTVWESSVWSAYSRNTWKMMGGVQPATSWGSADPGTWNRRIALNIVNHTLQQPSSIAVHMNHDYIPEDAPDFVLTPRDMNAAMSNIMPIRCREDAILDEL